MFCHFRLNGHRISLTSNSKVRNTVHSTIDSTTRKIVRVHQLSLLLSMQLIASLAWIEHLSQCERTNHKHTLQQALSQIRLAWVVSFSRKLSASRITKQTRKYLPDHARQIQTQNVADFVSYATLKTFLYFKILPLLQNNNSDYQSFSDLHDVPSVLMNTGIAISNKLKWD